MNIRDKIPGLDADALKTLRTNATRLSASGTPKQKDQARDVLILVDEEEANRREALPPAPPKTRRKTGTAGPSKAGRKGRLPNVAT
ncbi:hypothetical protein [Oharaeibacter diazotrophicus]|uniref:Uncharacterized protein n=1 Tax=Oharaeibacter diazotrophicus TaxID=1920512 RepID=A0A4R6RDA7_9HYPH|nr:hypothetical protein [Oharaeibacter diazotrophicus]TDP84231.1 hypothetical protein EDD54_2836 [Oharaeibacter diazotrophicus]BBE73269.1 hypothetical protein OHA_1_02878 [Pleomorphomonas sp. SM30]GLS75059.1 hypothetical protein GCM10007904_03940 [Oharaeibacter diazotrophicus]